MTPWLSCADANRSGAPVLAETYACRPACAAAGRLGELCLTMSPQLTAGDAARVLNGPAMAPIPLRLGHVLEEGGFVFLRYVRG